MNNEVKPFFSNNQMNKGKTTHPFLPFHLVQNYHTGLSFLDAWVSVTRQIQYEFYVTNNELNDYNLKL